MKFLRVQLEVPAPGLEALRQFYASTLGLEAIGRNGVRVGETELAFRAVSGMPFYHFAFLVPGDRFDAARTWAARRTTLLDGGDIDDVVFDFRNWDALALYFLDPAGNIVELIAHRGEEENGRRGAFEASELVGLSELGVVGEQTELSHGLEQLGLHRWDGVLAPGRLAFYGDRARTFIVTPPSRGWLPTDRLSEAHPTDATISGIQPASAIIGVHRVSVTGSAGPVS